MTGEIPDSESVKLNEYTFDEWREVARKFMPEWTDEQYAAEWDDFQKVKAEHERAKNTQ